MQLINTGKYVLKFYFSDPGASPSWVSNAFKYIDKLPDQHRQSLIDIHFKNNGADVPLAFINLAKLGFVALEKRFEHSDQNLKLETLDEEFLVLKKKIDSFVKQNNFGPERSRFYIQELDSLEKKIKAFSQKLKESKSFFYKKKDAKEAPAKKQKAAPGPKKSNSRLILLVSLFCLVLISAMHQQIGTFFWQIFINSKVESISADLKISKYEIQGRRLVFFISELELKSKTYTELKQSLQSMMDKAFAKGFSDIYIKTNNNEMVAKNVMFNKRPNLYMFYVPQN